MMEFNTFNTRETEFNGMEWRKVEWRADYLKEANIS